MPPRLRPVPEAPLRAVGMVRVSKERDEMISPELQRTAIEDHCARRGYQVVRWIEGVDESGSQRRSKWWARLDQGVELVEAGAADVLVVWRFSRTSRQRLRWAVAIDRVEVAGGLLESATEPLDTSTASGRLARGMLAEFAAYEAESIGNTWREVHARRTSRGLPANGKPRFGYRVVDGVHRPDPETGPVLGELYRRYVAGESVYSLVGWLNGQGLRTVAGYSKGGPGPWTQITLRRCLDSGFGAGLLMVRGSRQRGVHEPVVDEATWTAYLAAREGRRTLRRSERSSYLLSGLLRCHAILEGGKRCGAPMGGGQFGSGHQPKYRCTAAAAARRHRGGYVMTSTAERVVRGWVERQATDVTAAAQAQLATAAQRLVRRGDARSIEREVTEVERSLARLTVDRARGLVPEQAYAAARDELQDEQARLGARLVAARADAQEFDVRAVAVDAAANWDLYGTEHLRGLLRKLIARIEVTPGRTRCEVRVVPNWAEEFRP